MILMILQDAVAVAAILLAVLTPIIAWGFKMSNTISVLQTKIDNMSNANQAKDHKDDEQDIRIMKIEIDVVGLYAKLESIQEKIEDFSRYQRDALQQILNKLKNTK